MQTQFPIAKFIFMDLLYRTKFPKRRISEHLNEGYKDFGGINTDPLGNTSCRLIPHHLSFSPHLPFLFA